MRGLDVLRGDRDRASVVSVALIGAPSSSAGEHAATAPQGRIAGAPSDDGGAAVRGALKNGAVARSRSCRHDGLVRFGMRAKAMLRRLYEATWGRVVALTYDRFMAATEKAGLTDRRRALLSQAEGRCLEIGAGTGVNLELWPDGIEALVLTEPDRHMAGHLRQRAESSERPVEIVEAPGERLPFEDASFDTVAMTLVLCTAPDPPAVLGEVRRVLTPGGRVLFLEHVRSQDPRRARWQDRLHGPWYAFGYGCNCNRDTLATINASGLRVEQVDHGEMPQAPSIVRPMIVGVARELGAIGDQ
jgi:SAM-dependent methyltransferase